MFVTKRSEKLQRMKERASELLKSLLRSCKTFLLSKIQSAKETWPPTPPPMMLPIRPVVQAAGGRYRWISSVRMSLDRPPMIPPKRNWNKKSKP